MTDNINKTTFSSRELAFIQAQEQEIPTESMK